MRYGRISEGRLRVTEMCDDLSASEGGVRCHGVSTAFFSWRPYS